MEQGQICAQTMLIAVIWVQGKQAETETWRSQCLWAGKRRKEADVGSEACQETSCHACE